jgi:polyisoprenyl-phosphate glycosyltransferase
MTQAHKIVDNRSEFLLNFDSGPQNGSAKQDLFVSVIVRLHNHAALLNPFTSELIEVLTARYSDFEIIYVDDGSTDCTRQTIDELLRRYEGIRYLRLSRNFGREVSVYAGMQSAIGDYIVTMSLQTDPPALIPGLVDRAVRHGGLVFGTCARRLDESFLYRWTRMLFVWISVHIFHIPLEKNASQFMVFSRRALNDLLEIKDRYSHIRVLTAYIGYTQESFAYEQVPRGERLPMRSLGNGLGAGIRIIFANSSLPLRAIAWLGGVAALANLLVTTVGGIGREPHDSALDYLAGLPVQNALMFLVLAAVLAVLAEYITTLTEESHNRPAYYIREERTSSTLIANPGRRNVVG